MIHTQVQDFLLAKYKKMSSNKWMNICVSCLRSCTQLNNNNNNNNKKISQKKILLKIIFIVVAVKNNILDIYEERCIFECKRFKIICLLIERKMSSAYR